MTPETKILQIRCSGCQAQLKLKSELLGRTIACPKCHKKMKLVKPNKSPAPAFSLDSLPAPPPDLPSHSSRPPLNVPPQPSSYTPVSYSSAYPKKRSGSKKSSFPWLWVGIAVAAASIFLVVGVVAIAWMIFSGGTAGPEMAAGPELVADAEMAASSNAMAARSAADFPTLGEPQAFGNTNIVWHRVLLPRPNNSPLKLNIFIPKGNHPDKSMPVMFEAPAGTPLLHGASIEVPRPDTEYLPFTEAGMITVSYDIDGEMPSNIGPDAGVLFMNALNTAYTSFVAADAGVDNGKLAIDFVLARLPMADPNRLMTWGHSSAATLALLLASKDSRISKCIAMAPITDLRPRLGDALQEPAMMNFLPNLEMYLVSGSPLTHVQQLRCPVFIAHAKNDDNAPFDVTKTYVEAIRRAGGKVNFLELQREGHYQPLLEASIPQALEWLK